LQSYAQSEFHFEYGSLPSPLDLPWGQQQSAATGFSAKITRFTIKSLDLKQIASVKNFSCPYARFLAFLNFAAACHWAMRVSSLVVIGRCVR